MNLLAPFLAGFIFAFGLVLGGMTQPSKVFYFLDVSGGRWDPSLAFVMGGALVVFGIAFRLVTRRPAPLLGGSFLIPKRTELTPALLGGAAVFGVGWALAGFCPGPAVVAAGSAMNEAIVFVPAMVAGMALSRSYDSARSGSSTDSEPCA